MASLLLSNKILVENTAGQVMILAIEDTEDDTDRMKAT